VSSAKGYWRVDLEPIWAAYCGDGAGPAAQPARRLRVVDGASEE
jgi:hypothetical protein